MLNEKEKFTYLYHQYQNNSCTALEFEEFKQILNNPDAAEMVNELIDANWNMLAEEQLQDVTAEKASKIEGYITLHPQMKPTRQLLWPKIAIAASILLISVIAIYFVRNSFVAEPRSIAYANDVAPGINHAVLTLSDGQKIALTDTNSGNIASQAGLLIVKDENGQLVYKVTGHHKAGAETYNEITTYNGNQQQIILPDGTKVWLNAASSIKFPTTFENKSQRKVLLSGEAYFEVTHNKSVPFRVTTAKQEVEVLGTMFNISSYTDEPAVKTTLVEGSVRVNRLDTENSRKQTDAVVLTPGQQAVLNAKDLKIANVDIENEIDWKNGDFVMNNAKLEDVLRKVARWYNVQIIYEDEKPVDLNLSGIVSRSKNISSVLSLIEATGKVRFKVDGKTITVMK
ncbi:FecR family protein [Pedobacter nyackensis]|uniref:FecR family protein n=1 Tax=Pedobacter nyackensis TaxID=475255 RepID=UPI00292D1E5F|nr:FecR domain-containing protein [Pedobacter nyackensis]